MVLPRWSLCLLSECFSFLVLSFSCLSFFEMRAVECSCPVLRRKVIMMMMFEAWGFFFGLFLFLFQPPIWMELYWREWGCSKRKDKKANSQRGALIWLYYWLTECQTMVSYFVESNCFTLRGLSCLHIKQAQNLKRHIPDSKELKGDHWELLIINWPAFVVCMFEGESSLPVIQTNVQSAIDGTMSMFCLGFGNDVDYSFLDVMCRQNKGFARRIFEGSDAALQLQVE